MIFFFFLLSHPMHHSSVMPFRATKKHTGGWHMCFKESAYSRDTLEKMKNHDIKEEDAWRHFFAEINNNYIEQEITWIGTLT